MSECGCQYPAPISSMSYDSLARSPASCPPGSRTTAPSSGNHSAPACPPHTQPRPSAPHTADSSSSSSPAPILHVHNSQVADLEQQPVLSSITHCMNCNSPSKVQLDGPLGVGLDPGCFCRRKNLLDHSFVLTDHQVDQFVRDRWLGPRRPRKASRCRCGTLFLSSTWRRCSSNSPWYSSFSRWLFYYFNLFARA